MQQGKKELRVKMLEKRNALSPGIKRDLDILLCERLAEFADRHRCRTIHTYLPMGSEINLYPLLEEWLRTGRKLVTPKSLPGRKLVNLELQSLDQLEEGVFGTKHPAGDMVYEGRYDLILVPGLAFDEEGFRLGYGAGYYDVFLSSLGEVLKIAACYPFQYKTRIPREPHDVRLDEIIY